MASNLTLSEAVNMVADPALAIGFQTDEIAESGDDYGQSGRFMSVNEAARLFAQQERKSNGKRRKRDHGGRLDSINQAARLLVGEDIDEDDTSSLSLSEAAHAYSTPAPKRKTGSLTESEAVAELTRREVAAARASTSPAQSAMGGDYAIAKTNVAFGLQQAKDAKASVDGLIQQFVEAVFREFPYGLSDAAVAHFTPQQYQRYLEIMGMVREWHWYEQQADAAVAQAWRMAHLVENNELVAKHPDVDAEDIDAMVGLLRSVLPEDEAVAVVSNAAYIDTSDPRVRQIIAAAAGSGDGDDMAAELRDSGFDETDIAMIAEGSAKALMIDHRVRSILLKASRNVSEREAA